MEDDIKQSLANHARVLDWFRSIDTNFDGCISKNEMAFALHALGMNASPKEVQQLFDALDPDGNGVVEFEELQTALRQGLQLQSAPKKRPLSRAQIAYAALDAAVLFALHDAMCA